MHTPDLLQRITTDPDICHGKPVVRGLRYPVETILELLAAGMTHQEILEDYEDLEEEDILTCEEFAKGDATGEEAAPEDSSDDLQDHFLANALLSPEDEKNVRRIWKSPGGC
jgi:uncharacterized protein (DUF433 family)